MATVTAIRDETSSAKTFRLRLSSPSPHLAGQHYEVRLTAPDGYSASRWYSVASAPDDPSQIEITVQRLPLGEVSTFLHDEVIPDDELEVRGPIGGWFVWRGDTPALLIGGGSGLVPLMAMLRLARRLGMSEQVRLVVSVRRPEDLYYSEELPGPETAVVYSRQAPPGYGRPPGRMTVDDIAPLVVQDSVTYICGSSMFAEAATGLALKAGVPSDRIRIERFGPTG